MAALTLNASWTRTLKILLDWLDPGQLWFPDLSQALDDPDGLLASEEIYVKALVVAYHSGIFLGTTTSNHFVVVAQSVFWLNRAR